MHELSIAQALIEQANTCAAAQGASRVLTLNLRIGRLSGVAQQALLFSFELAAEDTPCAGARLAIEEIPIRAMCPQCEESKDLGDSYCFICPDCHSPTAELLSGQELELVSIEIDFQEQPAHDAASA